MVPAVIKTTRVFGEKGVNMGNMPSSATSPSSPSPPTSERGNLTAAFEE
jgi:hypothetical protein